ncbi:MAG TPA: glycosyltransferase family 1 protein, partial [bacterium]|nr:glycosyltransferase family 1 protein [bacterium]
ISRYHSALLAIDGASLSLKFSNNKFLKNIERHGSFFPSFSFPEKGRVLEYINRPNSISYLKELNFDLFHPTYYYPYFLKYLDKKPFVLTIHDMIHEIFGGSKKIIEHKKLLAERASGIIAVSENTKDDILRFYKISEKRIKVIYHGTSFQNGFKMLDLQLPSKFILYVGGREGYKNFDFFLKAIKPVFIDSDLFLICAGGGSFSKKETALFKELGLLKKIIYCSVNDLVLQTLYSMALFFVFPSKYEGFGIPIIESFSCGCPVVVSDIKVFREVAGDAALFFNAEDSTNILSVVKKAVLDDGLKEKLVCKGNLRAGSFSWESTRQETISFYEKVCDDSL